MNEIDVLSSEELENDEEEEEPTLEITEKTVENISLNNSISDDLLHSIVERESWESKLSFTLTLVGYAVGFGNVWRFPYLLQENGGVVFLIPYTVSVIFLGVPIFYMELAIGQRLRKGPLGSWHEISPYLGGMGITTAIMCFVVLLYYNTLIAWVISYFFDSFRANLGYSDCTYGVTAASGGCDIKSQNTECQLCNTSGASQYYWYKRVLDISTGIDDPGNFSWWIMMCITLTWIMVYGIIVKGIKIAGKVIYFTSLFPYVVFTIFLIRGLILENMSNGYTVLFTPRWEKLFQPTVWKTAASQILFSLGIGYGCLIAFASYLKPNNDCHTDAILVTAINCGSSFLATIVMFPYLGHYGTKVFEQCKIDRQVNLRNAFGFTEADDVIFSDAGPVNYYMHDGSNYSVSLPLGFNAEKFPSCTLRDSIESSASGTGFVFIVFAQAIATLPASQVWALLFFFMLLTLGIDSAFGVIEGCIAAIVDLQYKLKKWIISTIVCGISLFLSLMFSWGWGQYILVFLDDFAANWPLLLVAIFECFGIGWVYGLQKFARDAALMTGKRPGLYWLICWKYISPLLVFIIFIFTLVEISESGIGYRVWNDEKATLVTIPYPPYAIALGFLLTIFIIMWMPLVAILRYYGIHLIKDEAPIDFPEEELKKERNYNESEDPTNSVTKLIYWGNLGVYFGNLGTSKTNPDVVSAGGVSGTPSSTHSTTQPNTHKEYDYLAQLS